MLLAQIVPSVAYMKRPIVLAVSVIAFIAATGCSRRSPAVQAESGEPVAIDRTADITEKMIYIPPADAVEPCAQNSSCASMPGDREESASVSAQGGNSKK